MFAPLLSQPPDWTLPDPVTEAQWYGEIWVRYPLETYLLPSHFGHVFRARSAFRIIMNDACQAAYSTGSEITLARANELLTRLKTWFACLPDILQPKSLALPGHLQLQ